MSVPPDGEPPKATGWSEWYTADFGPWRTRRLLILLLLGIAAFVVALRLLILRDLGTAGQILDSLLGALIAYVLWMSLNSVLRRPDELRPRVVGANQLDATLQKMAQGTQLWWYRGNAGRYFRADTLPRLERLDVPVAIRLCLLDPADPDALERHEQYRVAASGQDGFFARKAQLEVWATILRIVALRTAAPVFLSDVQIFLTPVVTAVRTDISSSQVLVTPDGFDRPGLAIPRDNPFAGAYLFGFWAELAMARELRLPSEGLRINKLNAETARRCLCGLAVGIDDHTPEKDLEELVELVRSRRQPYA
jgi:hypothetical protein